MSHSFWIFSFSKKKSKKCKHALLLLGNKSFEAFPVSTFQVLVLHGSEFHFGSSLGKAGSGSGPELNSPHDPEATKGALRVFLWERVDDGLTFCSVVGKKAPACHKIQATKAKISSLFCMKSHQKHVRAIIRKADSRFGERRNYCRRIFVRKHLTPFPF